MLTSIGLTLTGFSIYWWRKGYASFSQPGQMLLIQYAATLALYFVSVAFALAMSGAGSGSQLPSWYSSLPVIMGIGSLLFGVLVADRILLLVRVEDRGHVAVARAVLVVRAHGHADIDSGGDAHASRDERWSEQHSNDHRSSALDPGNGAAGGRSAAVATDLVALRKRSWTHWAGIILWLVGQIGSLLMGLYYMFLWRIV